jgi:peptidoglycan/LPS O-acetylase OafA/YrhL
MVRSEVSGGARIATLDGLRAVSIALVVFAHCCGTGLVPMNPCGHVAADLGVRTFFVTSGFLITTLLMRELRSQGRISLKRFFTRRCLRIFPAFYCYIAVLSLLAIVGVVALDAADLARAGTYTMNFRAERPWVVGHLWSLAVEEQFYLLWPLIIVLLGLRRAALAACAAIACAPLLRLAAWYFVPSARALTDQAFPCVFDTLAVGCCLAIVRDRLERSERYRAWQESRWFLPSCLASLCCLFVSRPWFELGVATTIANVSIALCIHWTVTHPARLLPRVLESRPLVWLGALSYPLYLWQQPFLNRHVASSFTAFPLNIALAISAAAVWYYVAEGRLVALRRTTTVMIVPAPIPFGDALVFSPSRTTAAATAPGARAYRDRSGESPGESTTGMPERGE